MTMRDEHDKKPRRRVLLTLKLGADNREEMIHALEQIALEMRRGYLMGEAAGGGYSSGYWLKVTEDETVTHDTYFAAINAMIEAEQADRALDDIGTTVASKV
jgi:hypothetical protein